MRLNHDTEQAERFRAIELVDERGHRLFAQDGKGRGEVDQVAGVRHHRRDAALFDALAEQPHFGSVERLAAPLTRILGEDLQRFAAVHDGALDGLRDAARDRHVGADAQHSINIMAA